MVQPFVYKFGGASVKDAHAFKNVANILKARWKNGLVIVVSAAGDTTDHLELITQQAFSGEPYEEELSKLESYHLKICSELFPENHAIFSLVNNEFSKLRNKLESSVKTEGMSFFYDQVIVFGELISTRILQEYLCQETHYCLWQDARELIATDSNHKMGKVDWVLTMQRCRKYLSPKLEKFPVVTQGFMGSDWLGNTTTLGREGSDFTAAILAVSLAAKSVTIWKDVAGILNGDPDIFPDAVKFDYLDFEEAAEMTYFGAKVIHPKTIKPLAKHRIPLYVKSFVSPDSNGTVIGSFEDQPKIPITIIKQDQVMISFRVRDLSKVGGFHFEEIYKTAKNLNWNINLIAASAVTIRIVIDRTDQVTPFPKQLLENFHIDSRGGLKLITVKNYQSEHEEAYTKTLGHIFLTEKSQTTLQIVSKSQ